MGIPSLIHVIGACTRTSLNTRSQEKTEVVCEDLRKEKDKTIREGRPP